MIITQLKKFMVENREQHDKNSFWPSESEAMVFDIYHRWIGTEPTNPIAPEKLIMFSAAKMIELAFVEEMRKAGLLSHTKEDQLRIEMERCGIKITGYIDAVAEGGVPVEIKSFYGNYQAKDLQSNKPKVSYLKQLAMYMDALGKERGRLIYLDRGTGDMYEFELLRKSETEFMCYDIEFDLLDTYRRWARLYNNNIMPKVEPKPDYRYKIPVENVDWRSLSKSDISKARNNKKVIGDHPWAVQYSNYKNLIIERQGSELGYTESELKQIADLTKGYSNW